MTGRFIPVIMLLAVPLSTPAQQSATIQTETRVVLVDAIVTAKNGAYVRDLTQKDFRIWEDNKEQTIKSFAFESEASQPRSLVLFFDQSTMQATDQIPVRQAASRFIDAETGPNRKMALVSYDGVLHVRQNFTDNAGRLKDALPGPSSRVTEAEQQARAEHDSLTGGTIKDVGAIDDTGSRNMLQALRYLGTSLGVLPGRKIVIVFAGRIASSSSQKFELKEAIDACNKSGVAVYPVDVRQPSATSPVSDGLIDISPSIFPDSPRAEQRQRNGPQGSAEGSDLAPADSGAGNQQLLAELAGRTGGFVIRNANDLLGGLQAIAGEQDQYYALTFTPPESKEGSCHTLRVKVDRGGTNVRARNSYCTAKPPDLLAGTIVGRDLEKRAAETQAGNMTASVQLPYFYSAPDVARVRLAAEITPGTLKFERLKGKLHGEINLLGMATTEDGGVPARFSDNLKFDFDTEAQVEAWKARPFHYEKEFRIAPGQYKFTLAFGQAGESDASFGKTEAPLQIDSWNGSELALSGLALSRESHPAGDLGLSFLTGDQKPLASGGTQVVPSGSDRFAKSAPAFFYFEVYDPDPASVTVRVRALDRKTGEAKWDSGTSKLPLPAGGGKPSLPAMANLPLDKLTPGDWRLEITATDSAGKTAMRTADFVVQ